MKNRVARRPCTQVLSKPPTVVNGFGPVPSSTIGNAASVFLKSGLGPEQTRVPGKRRIEVVHKILRKNVRISGRKRVQRLRGKSR